MRDRATSGALCSTAEAEALSRSRSALCSKSGEALGSTLHACVDGAGRVFRLIASPSQHSDLRHATALASGTEACDAALDRGYVSAALHPVFAAQGCTVHIPARRDKTRQSWMSFAHLTATIINSRLAEFSHRA